MFKSASLIGSTVAFLLMNVHRPIYGEVVKISNKWLEITVDPTIGSLQAASTAAKKPFIRSAQWTAGSGEAALVDIQLPNFGRAKAIKLSRRSGAVDVVVLPDELPFALFRSTFHNDTTSPIVHNKLKTISFAVDLGKPVASLRVQGTHDRLTSPADRYPGSYSYLAVAEPRTRNGAVFGWISHDRGSGVLFASVEQDLSKVDAQLEYGNLRIEPGKSAESEILAVGYFDDARLGLEAYADAVARYYQIKLPAQPAGYCTWYSDRYGGASDETHLIELAKCARKHLSPFGLSFVQIDDKWQIGKRREGPAKDFTGHNPTGPYPSGMKHTGDQLKHLGFTPGIWFMPFAGDHQDPLFASHQDWFVKRKDGSAWETSWGGTSLDMTHPDVRKFVHSMVHRIAHDWGYTYFKMDGLYTGTATKQVYVNDGYERGKGPDQLGEAVFHDPNVTNIEAYRSGLKLVREAAGPNVFFLGCNVSQNMRTMGGSFGLLDAMRIGPDNGAPWERLVRGPRTGGSRYFLHGRVWYNDPDPVYVRNSMPIEHARLIASWVGITGQLFTDSDWLPNVAPERIEILKRTIAPHKLLPRPVDYFEQDMPRMWLLTDTRRSSRQDVVALFNWDSKSAVISASADHIGLPKANSYVAFDYWANAFLPPFSSELSVQVAKQSCRVLAVRPMLDRPQVLSTSRHVAQGIVDELEQSWDPATNTLSGLSNVVANDPYEMRLATLGADGTTWQIDSAELLQGAKATNTAINKGDGFSRVTFELPISGRIAWAIKFNPIRTKRATQLAAVSQLQAATEGTRAVNLTWQGKPVDGVVYEIKRNDGKVVQAPGLAWTDDTIEKGKTYTYDVSATDFFGHRSTASTATVSVPLKLDPGPVPPKPAKTLASLKPQRVQPNSLNASADKTVEIAGKTYGNAITLPVGSRLVYDRASADKRIVAVIAIDSAQRSDASVVCKIINDDGEDIGAETTLLQTPPLQQGDCELWHVNVELPENCKRVHVTVERADSSSRPVSVNLVEAGFVGR